MKVEQFWVSKEQLQNVFQDYKNINLMKTCSSDMSLVRPICARKPI